MEEKFDAIVVGGGPAGCACALRLARHGLKALLLERGQFAGAKNVWGGAFFGPSLSDLLPDFAKEAPIERRVTTHKYSLLSNEGSLSLDFSVPDSDDASHGFILLRSKFDRWFADQAAAAGAIVVGALAADDIIRENGRVEGVIAGDDKLFASVVIACDGVNSQLAQKANLRGELAARELKQGVKEVIEFPPGVIGERFNLREDEGLAWEFIGDCTRGLPGGGFIYTNRNSLSVGIVVQLDALAERKVQTNDLLDDFKQHPAVSRLIEGGQLVEYSAHLIPVAGLEMIPRLYTDGMLVAGDAAAMVVGTGLILEGANFAIASGVAAADTVLEAKRQDDFSSASLASYRRRLEANFVLQDMKTYRRAPRFLENPRIYTSYPELAVNLAGKIFTNSGRPRQTLFDQIREAMRGRISWLDIIRDLTRLWRAL